MNKKKFRRKVTKYHDKWKQLLALSWWRHKIVFYDNMTNSDGTSPLAECEVNWQYFEYTININEYGLSKFDDAKINRIILHELLHAVVSEMREDGLKHEERVVSHLTDAITYILERKDSNGKEIQNQCT